MAFELGDQVKITEVYTEDLDNGDEFLGMEGVVVRTSEKFDNVFHVRFPDAPYYKDYWIMYEDEIELVANV